MEVITNLSLTKDMMAHVNRFTSLLSNNSFKKVNGYSKIDYDTLDKLFRSRSTRHRLLKLLKENNIIEVDGNYSKRLKIPLGYRLFTGESKHELSIIQEEVFFSSPVQDKDLYTFFYKGFREVSVVISKEDKRFAKECRLKLGDFFSEYNFQVACIDKDWSDEKIWFLYNKIVINYPLKQIDDGLLL